MDKEYSVTFTWTDEEFLQFSKFAIFERDRKMKWIKIILALCIVTLVALNLWHIAIKGEIQDTTSPIVLFIMVIFEYHLLYGWKKQSLKNFRKNKFIYGVEQTIILSDTSIIAKTAYNETNIEYALLDCIAETPTHFYVMTAKRTGFSIPKGKCSSEFVDKMHGVMAEHPNLVK